MRPVPARELDRVLRLREVAAIAAVRGLHVCPPDRAGCGTAEAGQLAGVGVTNPDGGRYPRRVAHEPGVGLALGGAGLARLRASESGWDPGPLADHLLEDARHLVCEPVGDRAVALALVRNVGLPAREHDLGDRGGVVMHASV